MSAVSLGSRAIIGEFYSQLEAVRNAGYLDKICMNFKSDQASEEYRWLGMVPSMREFIGGRQAKGFTSNGITIANKVFEATLEVSVDDLRRDKTGQIMLRVGELADRANNHWYSLIASLIKNGGSQACYDGKNFFSSNHAEGSSGSQSNALTFTIASDSVVDSAWRGTTTNPSPHTVQAAVLKAIGAMLGFKDNEGEPMNEGASRFLVMVPPNMMASAAAALALPTLQAGQANVIPALAGNQNLSFDQVTNPRLTATDKLIVFRTDARTKPIILQEEVPTEMKALAEGSDEEIKNRRHLYTVEAIRNAGYGMWQQAVQVAFA